MKKFKLRLVALALVLGVIGSSFTSPTATKSLNKLTIIIRVWLSPTVTKDIDPSQFDVSLCPTENPDIVCAKKIKDNVVITIWVGGYYTGA